MCILLPSCQENPRSCPSTVPRAALARLVSLISHVSPQALGGEGCGPSLQETGAGETTGYHFSMKFLQTSPLLPIGLLFFLNPLPADAVCQVEGTARRCEDEIHTREQQRCGPPHSHVVGVPGEQEGGGTSSTGQGLSVGWGEEKVEGGGARLDTSVLQRARMETFGPFEHSDWVKVNDGGQWDFFTSSGAGTIGHRGPTLQSIPARFLLLLRKC